MWIHTHARASNTAYSQTYNHASCREAYTQPKSKKYCLPETFVMMFTLFWAASAFNLFPVANSSKLLMCSFCSFGLEVLVKASSKACKSWGLIYGRDNKAWKKWQKQITSNVVFPLWKQIMERQKQALDRPTNLPGSGVSIAEVHKYFTAQANQITTDYCIWLKG